MVVASPVLLLLAVLFAGMTLIGSGVSGTGDRAPGGDTSEEPSAAGSTTNRETTGEATGGEKDNTITTTSSENSPSGATTSKDKEETTTSESTSKGKQEPPEEILVAGAEDNTGGLLTDHRLVSYYGHPLSGQMGVLGQYEDPQNMMAGLKEQASAYTELTPQRPAIPTIELIASVAQGFPGEDGLYLRRTSKENIEKYAKLAEENDALLLLDIQIGYSTISKELDRIKPFLKRDYVHLAIDCEWNMAPGQIPGEQFGQCSGENIMGAADTLSRMVEENDLPPKVLLVHQFRSDMVINKEALQPTENVEMVVHADGFGVPENKFSKYRLLVQEQPVQYGGFKLFYNQDVPLLSPRQVLEELDPDPAVISYQ